MNDDFLTKCQRLDPAADIDCEKNRQIIKDRLSKENIMQKNKKTRKPLMVAAILVAVMSISAVAYAAVPIVLRHFDLPVVSGEEFVNSLELREIIGPGGPGMYIFMDIDREALADAGEAVVVDFRGLEWVVADELSFDNIEDGLAMLEIENLLLPGFLPEGFAFEEFIFPVNPNNHQYTISNMRSAENAQIVYANGDKSILLQVINTRRTYLVADYDMGQQSLLINGNKAILSGSLNDYELAMLEGVALYELSPGLFRPDVTGLSPTPNPETGQHRFTIMMRAYGSLYTISSEDVGLFELVSIAASMQ